MELEGKRKFIFAMTALPVISIIAWFDVISGPDATAALTTLIALFGGANAVEHMSKALAMYFETRNKET